MVWRECTKHINDCYFCCCKVEGFNTRNKRGITYPDLESAGRPIPHSIDVPVPVLPKLIHVASTESIPRRKNKMSNMSALKIQALLKHSCKSN